MPNRKQKNHSKSQKRRKGKAVSRGNSLTVTLNVVGPAISVFGATDPLPGGSLGFEYSISALPQIAQYSALFDLYRIDWVEISFEPTANMSALINATEPPGGVNPSYTLPCLHTCIDYTSAASPMNVSEIMQHATYKRVLLTRPYRRRFTGHARTAVSQLGATSTLGYKSVTSADWFELSSPSLSFGSLLCWVDPVSSGSVALIPLKINTFVKYHLTFRNIQ